MWVALVVAGACVQTKLALGGMVPICGVLQLVCVRRDPAPCLLKWQVTVGHKSRGAVKKIRCFNVNFLLFCDL